MNFLINKIIKAAGCISAFIGFFVMLGAVGSSDLAVEMGVYEPWNAHLGTMIAGLVLLLIGVCIMSMYEEEVDDE